MRGDDDQQEGMFEPYQPRDEQTPFRIPSQYNLAAKLVMHHDRNFR
jgi:hypothetical protein